jgi:hypothetical protein
MLALGFKLLQKRGLQLDEGGHDKPCIKCLAKPYSNRSG